MLGPKLIDDDVFGCNLISQSSSKFRPNCGVDEKYLRVIGQMDNSSCSSCCCRSLDSSIFLRNSSRVSGGIRVLESFKKALIASDELTRAF